MQTEQTHRSQDCLMNPLKVLRSWNIEKWHEAEIKEILGRNAHRVLDWILGPGQGLQQKEEGVWLSVRSED